MGDGEKRECDVEEMGGNAVIVKRREVNNGKGKEREWCEKGWKGISIGRM